jgi:hypothetical protein
VYFGTDENAITLADTVTEHSYTPASLDFGTTYFWKVNEVGDAGTYAGEVWSFTTREYAVIDDFESYNNDDNRIYDTWIDGWVNNTGWQQWKIPLSEFTSAGVKMNAVKTMTIGVGNKATPAAGGTGRLYIDDVGYGRPAQ